MTAAFVLALVLAPAGCGKPFWGSRAQKTTGPAEQAGSRHRRAHAGAGLASLPPEGPSLAPGGTQMVGPSLGGAPATLPPPSLHEVEQRERSQYAVAAAPPPACALVERQPVGGRQAQEAAALAGDLARIETELGVLQRAGYHPAGRQDAAIALSAARDAATLAGGWRGGATAGGQLVWSAAALADAVSAGDRPAAERASARLLDADSAIRDAAHLVR